jgi:hypothetical protein
MSLDRRTRDTRGAESPAILSTLGERAELKVLGTHPEADNDSDTLERRLHGTKPLRKSAQ